MELGGLVFAGRIEKDRGENNAMQTTNDMEMPAQYNVIDQLSPRGLRQPRVR